MNEYLIFREAIRAILKRTKPGPEIIEEMKRREYLLKSATGFMPGAEQVVLFSQRAVMTAGSSGLIATEIGLDATSMDEMATVKKAGAVILTGKNDIKVPSFGANSFAFVAENNDAPDAPDADDIASAVCRNAGYKDVSALFFLDNDAFADLLLKKALSYMDMALDAAVFGVQARSAVIPQGMGYYITAGQTTQAASVVPTWDTVLTLEHTVGATNKKLRGKLAYITSPAGAKILKSKYRDTGTTHFIMEDGKINGYPVFICDQVSDSAGSDTAGSLLIFGAWQDLAIRDYGMVVTVDKYSLAIANKVRLVFNWLLDVRGLSGVVDTGTTDDYEYALSWASVAIKAS